jgi:hypothetical protein
MENLRIILTSNIPGYKGNKTFILVNQGGIPINPYQYFDYKKLDDKFGAVINSPIGSVPDLAVTPIMSPTIGIRSPVLSPGGSILTNIPPFSPVFSGINGVFIKPNIDKDKKDDDKDTKTSLYPNFTVITPPITSIRSLAHPDQDPELRRKVVKHFYDNLKEVYFIGKFKKLLRYVIVDNNQARLVKSLEELNKNKSNENDLSLRIKFITENIFSKYDLEILISKLIAKYGMLFSEDENNMHWYNAKTRYSRKIKNAMYKKIKYRLQKKLKFD